MEGQVEIHPADNAARQVVDAWTEKFGHAPEWAGAWVALRPAKLFSYDARKADSS